MRIVKASLKHKLGNMLAGIFGIIDGLIMVISLGNINAQLEFNYNLYRNKRCYKLWKLKIN